MALYKPNSGSISPRGAISPRGSITERIAKIRRSDSSWLFDALQPADELPSNTQLTLQEVYPSSLEMIHKQGSDTKNVVALLSKEPIKQQLLDLINNTKIILKDLIAKLNACTQEYSDALDQIFNDAQYKTAYFTLPSFQKPNEFENLYGSLHHLLKTGLPLQYASHKFLCISQCQNTKSQNPSMPANEKTLQDEKIESYFRILAGHINGNKEKNSIETTVLQHYCNAFNLKPVSIESLLKYYARNDGTNPNTLLEENQNDFITKIAMQIKNSPFFLVEENDDIGAKNLFYFVFCSYYSNVLHTLEINKEFLTRYHTSHPKHSQLHADIVKHLKLNSSTSITTDDGLFFSLEKCAKQHQLTQLTNMLKRIKDTSLANSVPDLLNVLNYQTTPAVIFDNVLKIIDKAIDALKLTKLQNETSQAPYAGSLLNIEAIAQKCLRDSEKTLKDNMAEEVRTDLSTIVDFIKALNKISIKSSFEAQLDTLNAFFSKVIGPYNAENHDHYQHIDKCLVMILDQYESNTPLYKPLSSLHPHDDMLKARSNIVSKVFTHTPPVPFFNRVISNISLVYSLYLLCLLLSTKEISTLIQLTACLTITYKLKQLPQSSKHFIFSTDASPAFFVNILSPTAAEEKNVLRTSFKHSAENPEENFGPFLKYYELSRKASLLQLGEGEDGCESKSGISQSIHGNVFSKWFSCCADELVSFRDTDSPLNNYDDLRLLIKFLFIGPWYGYPLPLPSQIKSRIDLSKQEKDIADMVWFAGPKYETLSVYFIMKDIRLDFSSFKPYSIKPSSQAITSALCKMQIMLYLLYSHQQHIHGETKILGDYEKKSTYFQLQKLLNLPKNKYISILLDLKLFPLKTIHKLMDTINSQLRDNHSQPFDLKSFFNTLKAIFITDIKEAQLKPIQSHSNSNDGRHIYFHDVFLDRIFDTLFFFIQENIIPLTVFSSTLTVSQQVASHLNHPKSRPDNFKKWEIELIERVYNFSLLDFNEDTSQKFQFPNNILQWKETVISGLCNFESYKNYREKLEQFDPIKLKNIAIDEIIKSYIHSLSEDQFKNLSKEYDKTDMLQSEFTEECIQSCNLKNQLFSHIFQLIHSYKDGEINILKLGMGLHAIRTQPGFRGVPTIGLEGHRTEKHAFTSRDSLRMCPFAYKAKTFISMLLGEIGSYFVVTKAPSSILGSLSSMFTDSFDPFKTTPLLLLPRKDNLTSVTNVPYKQITLPLSFYLWKFMTNTTFGQLFYGVTPSTSIDRPRASLSGKLAKPEN